ncbi:helix-turn-helix domain-containing protein [Planosporangium mesophilum]|uniref:helix-turn-helix domain-containing protein n=1 Tax=Planosporangium mesophilum TaxID=689768 RepID=UPI00143A911E|nr:helix-turn-helix transcriptional regulator [Planosporangium mesophilum]NJC81543.1 helix-turn-helix domain-containing protein [Planosporangium mesophilum]
MSSSPSSNVQQARQALGQRLRDIRVEAGLSARTLGRLMGRHPSKVSRIEHGVTPPSAADIRAWCGHCGATDQVDDMVASLRAVEGMYVELRRLTRTGMRHHQKSRVPLYERTRLFRIYEPGAIPGLFQTPNYARTLLGRIMAFNGIPDDREEAVAARMDRQRVVHSGEHRFAVILEEWALRCRIGSAEMMAGQLGHLINVASFPSVSLGIIPANIDRTMWSSPGFWIFDEDRVEIETPSAELTITQPREIAVYARTFAELSSMAVYGAAARSLITAAINDLGADEDG